MSSLIGTDNQSFVTGRATLRSVTITPTAAGDASINMYDAFDITAEPKVIVKAFDKNTLNVHFNGIPFHDGLLIVPSANVAHYVVEYDHTPTI